jgi:hypothetical protein
MEQNTNALSFGISFMILIVVYIYYKSTKHNEKISSIMGLISILLYGGLITSSISSCENSNINGLYHDSFNNSIELQSNGTVHYSQLHGKYTACHTTGTWTKLNNNQLTISLEINSNCLFNQRYSGDWEIKDCFKYGEAESGCLVKGNEFYFFKQ